MPSLQIRNLPDDIYEALRVRAAREHRSVAQQAIMELRKMPEVERRDRRQAVLERARKRLQEEGPRSLPVSPEELVREDRER